MASFQVHKVYWVTQRDLVVLAGLPGEVLPRAGHAIDLPREVKGPGWVPIADAQTVEFADGPRPCVILDYAVLEGSPLMEFSDLEGKILSVRA
jgi:hypothetical protein